MASKAIHFRNEAPKPSNGHTKGSNSHGYSPPNGVQLETAPGRLGEAGYVRIKKS